MKKILAIMLIAVIAVAGVFAYEAPENTIVELKYVVEGLFQPAYTLFYDASEAPNSITVHANTDYFGIVAGESKTFTLKDATKFNSTLGSALKLAVSVEPNWTGTDQTGTNSANASELSIENFTVVKVPGADEGKVTQAADGENAVKMEYLAGQTLDRSGNNLASVATFFVKWTDAPDAAAQTYTANLTVAFTTM